MAGWHYIVIVVVVYARIPAISSQTNITIKPFTVAFSTSLGINNGLDNASSQDGSRLHYLSRNCATGSGVLNGVCHICPAGFFLTPLGYCKTCPFGTYQTSSGQTSCISCSSGTTTLQTGSTSSIQCVAICSSGFFRTTSGACQACPIGTYQPSTEQLACITCPSGTSTNQIASTSQAQCVGICSAGFFINTLGNCQVCSIGTFQPSIGQTSCISCPSGTTTLQTGSTSSSQCVGSKKKRS